MVNGLVRVTLAAEQVVAPDAARTPPSHAGCNRLTSIVVRKSLNQLLFQCLGLPATVTP
jgi:hypothetical protein